MNQVTCGMHYRISTALAPVRRHPADQAELITQFLYGETCELLDSQSQWRLLRSTRDAYEGWVDEKLIEKVAGEVECRHILASPIDRIPLASGKLFLPAGACLTEPHANTRDSHEWKRPAEEWMDDAMSFLGAPYLWGGKSILGIDCSGLVQIVAAMNGVQIPRDAWQQAEIGEQVDFLELSKAGDLAFFGLPEGRITHVGFVLLDDDTSPRGEGSARNILHASGTVRIDRLDHQGIFREDTQKYTHNLRLIKRMSF